MVVLPGRGGVTRGNEVISWHPTSITTDAPVVRAVPGAPRAHSDVLSEWGFANFYHLHGGEGVGECPAAKVPRGPRVRAKLPMGIAPTRATGIAGAPACPRAGGLFPLPMSELQHMLHVVQTVDSGLSFSFGSLSFVVVPCSCFFVPFQASAGNAAAISMFSFASRSAVTRCSVNAPSSLSD